MFRRLFTLSLAATTALLLSPTLANAQGVAVIEDFESYSTGTGNWGVTEATNASVNLGLNLVSPIQGTKDMSQLVGASLLSNGFTIQNLNLNVPVPSQATHFTFSMKSLLALNVSRTVKATFVTESGQHSTADVALPILGLNNVVDISFPLDSFSPAIPANATVTGVKLRFEAGVIALGLSERLDYLRFTWDNSSVEDWTVY